MIHPDGWGTTLLAATGARIRAEGEVPSPDAAADSQEGVPPPRDTPRYTVGVDTKKPPVLGKGTLGFLLIVPLGPGPIYTCCI